MSRELHPSDQGQRTEAIALAELVKRGYAVLVPFGSNHRFDFVILDKGEFVRVQCKTGWIAKGCVLFNASSSHYHRGKGQRGYKNEADIFLVYCPDNDKLYCLPVDEVGSGQPYLRLEPPKNNQKQGIRWAEEFELRSPREESNLRPVHTKDMLDLRATRALVLPVE